MEAKASLTAEEAAKYLGVSKATLQRQRNAGVGARFFKVGEGRNSKVLYPIKELDKWLESQLVQTA